MANPKLILREDRIHEDGLAPIILQLYINRKRVAITLKGMAIDPEFWDPEKQQVKRGFPDYRDRNLELQSYVGKSVEILKEYRLSGADMTPAIFRREFHSQATKQDFIAYARDRIKNEFSRHLISPGTRTIHLNSLSKLEEFAGSVMFGDISRNWIEEFDAWHAKLQAKKGNEGLRAREKVFKTCRKYLRMAEADGKRFKDPFMGLIWPRSKSRPVFLNQDELFLLLTYYRDQNMLESACLDEGKRRKMDDGHLSTFIEFAPVRLKKTIRAFLFQCFTGMRFDDARTVRHRDIEVKKDNKHLIFFPKKTAETSGVEVRMLITPIIEELIITKTGVLVETPPNSKYNLRLKEMAKICGIDKNLTSHVGRHTFATTSLERGISVEVLMELMGLVKLDTLMVYVHLTSKRRDIEMEKAWGTI